MEGYFKVHRKILDSQVFAHQTALKIWVWCLAKVTFKERFVGLKVGKGETTVKLNPGQFIFGRFKAEEELNIDGSTIYKWMQRFASPEFDMIIIESNNQYSIVTICNWEQYQNGDEEEVTTKEQPRDSHVTTEEQPRNTNNKDKNDNKVNNEEEYLFVAPEFLKPFELWIQYKKEKKQMYKSQTSLVVCYNNLLKLSGNNPEVAMQIVENSIANNYSGLFLIKQKQNKDYGITEKDFERFNR
jgi:hypothetical protein